MGWPTGNTKQVPTERTSGEGGGVASKTFAREPIKPNSSSKIKINFVTASPFCTTFEARGSRPKQKQRERERQAENQRDFCGVRSESSGCSVDQGEERGDWRVWVLDVVAAW